MKELNRILVPVDFSDCSRAALDHAISLAQKFDASVEVFHVYEPPYYVGDVLLQMPGDQSVTMGDYIRSQAEKLLDELVESVEGVHDVTLVRGLVAGVPYQAIVDKAKSNDYDLIVLGTHGRRGLSHLLMGSVAERVLRKAPCPVMVVRDEYPDED